jgi:dsDNA-specific endonuclease/ATPase MutS2
MKKEDLWIGDTVQLIKSGRVGKVKNIEKNGKIMVLVENKKVITNIENLMHITPEKEEKFKDIDEWISQVHQPPNEKKLNLKNKKPSNIIDLHIDKLDTHGKIILEQNILEFQLNCFKEWFEERYSKRIAVVTVIHGKGTGTLRNSLETWLNTELRVAMFNSINDGGALEIWMKY